MKIKKWTSLFLVICMVIALLPVRTFAAKTPEMIYELPEMEMSTEVSAYSVRSNFKSIA